MSDRAAARSGPGLFGELRSHWRDDIRPPVRRGLTVSLVLAVLSVVGGGVGDLIGWWDRVPFLTNFATGITGALFGVPFALVVVGMITKRQAEEADRRAAKRLAGTALASLADAGGRVLRAGAEDGPLVDLAYRLQDCAYDSRVPSGPVSSRDRPAFRESAVRSLDRCRAVVSALDLVLPPADDAGRAWDQTCTAWRFLVTYVRPRLLEAEVPWLTERQIAELDSLLRPANPPTLPLFELREFLANDCTVALEAVVEGVFGQDFAALHQKALAADRYLADRVEIAADETNHLIRTMPLLTDTQVSMDPAGVA